MLGLTLLALEGMARIAYYGAYGQGYGGGRPDAPASSTPLPPDPRHFYNETVDLDGHISHPFYAFSHPPADAALNTMPPRQRRGDTVVIGLLGGSVAEQAQPFLQRALSRWFAANNLPQQPAVLLLAVAGAKQPQQTMIVANTLLLGGEFDLIVNLDGYNEITGSGGWKPYDYLFPFFPRLWNHRVGLAGADTLPAGHISALRRKQARLAAIRETSPLRWSALFGLANRYRQERTAAQIIQRNHELAATESEYNLEKHGPRNWRPGEAELLPAAARVWYRSSLTLARLAALAGADYYHFLQPNQYVAAAKPLSPEERERAYKPDRSYSSLAIKGYPQLRELGRDLPGQGVNYFDLTGIFADRPETLYIDDCCHLNARGNELLAAAMVRRLEPALRRLARESPAKAVSPLAAARMPAEYRSPGHPDFRVSLPEGGNYLRYARAGCSTADTVPLFFLHLTPRRRADLPPDRREQGFADFTFAFTRSGGGFRRGACSVQFPLPDYPLAALRTGQLLPPHRALGFERQTGVPGELWSVELIVPIASDQLRADYAVLSAGEPVARDYFDLYELDNRLLYLRERCAAADTAAPFFLHIIPQDADDLPAARRAAGFAHGGFEFARRGGHFDGKCLAAVALPEYPIKEMRTGQYVAGQGELWSVALRAAP